MPRMAFYLTCELIWNGTRLHLKPWSMQCSTILKILLQTNELIAGLQRDFGTRKRLLRTGLVTQASRGLIQRSTMKQRLRAYMIFPTGSSLENPLCKVELWNHSVRNLGRWRFIRMSAGLATHCSRHRKAVGYQAVEFPSLRRTCGVAELLP
jgi:hypothetical protein